MSKDLQKKQLVTVFKSKGCNVSATCLALGISRKTFYEWRNNNEELKEELIEAEQAIIDNVETKLLANINSGCVTSTIFFLKTKAKDRGYTERTELKFDEVKPIRLEFTGMMTKEEAEEINENK